MKRKLALLAMASVLALSTVACGSGDSGDSAKKDVQKQNPALRQAQM